MKHEEGWTVRRIAKKLGVGVATAVRYSHKETLEDVSPTEETATAKVTRSGDDGEITWKAERPRSEKEMMEVFGMDPRRWVPKSFSGGMRETHKKDEGIITLYSGRIGCKRIMTEETERLMTEFFQEQKPLPKPRLKAIPKAQQDGQVLVFGLHDAHIGMYAWGSETGADFNVDIAVNRVYNAIDDMMRELKHYKINKIVAPIGGDFLHFDSVKQRTVEGQHDLDVDTRFARAYLAGLKCLTYLVERALEIAPSVQLTYVKGNHDASTGFGLITALAQRFFNDSRVEFDLRAASRKCFLYGRTLLAFDHGSHAKPDRLALAILTEYPEMAGRAVCREIHVGHKHQRKDTVFHGVLSSNGVLIRMNPSLCSADAWHYERAFTSPIKTLECWRYDDKGFRGSHSVAACDNKNENLDKGRVVPGGPNWREKLAL